MIDRSCGARSQMTLTSCWNSPSSRAWNRVVELAQCSVVEQLRIFFTAPVKRKVWSTMIFRFLRSASSISSSACVGIAGERLFDKDVLAVFQRRLGQFVVRPDRRDHSDGIDLGGRHQFGSVRGNPDCRNALFAFCGVL